MIALVLGLVAFVVGAIVGALGVVLSLMFWEPWFEDAQDEPDEFTERPQHDLDAAQLGRAWPITVAWTGPRRRGAPTLAQPEAGATFSGDNLGAPGVQAPSSTPFSFSGLDRNGAHDRHGEVVQ